MSKQPDIIFIHIPKTGGLSIQKAVGSEVFNYGHYTYDQVANKVEIDFNTDVFTFVRNPWDRLVSAFHFFYQMQPHCNWYRQSERVVKAIRKYETFQAFVKGFAYVREIMECEHFRPQSEFVFGKRGRVPNDMIGRFENLQADFDRICDSLGIERRELTHENKSTRSRDYRQYFTDVSMNHVIFDIYGEDIESFGYEFQTTKD